ncbi:MAG: helix-turn-helix transcriptional regulator [Frankia sp.]|nr:helix-turn-helix transcriptional regulator [Frankia sp.]
MRELGDFIRDQRRAAQISLRQLAKQAGVSNPYLSQIERGLRKPSAEILQQIAKALRISAEVLYVQAGILEEREGGEDVHTAVLADEVLTARQKQVILDIYDAFRRENALAAESGDSAADAPAAPDPATPDPAALAGVVDAADNKEGVARGRGRRATGARAAAGTKPGERPAPRRRAATAAKAGKARSTATPADLGADTTDPSAAPGPRAALAATGEPAGTQTAGDGLASPQA